VIPILGFATKWALERRTEALRSKLSTLTGFAGESTSRIPATGHADRSVPAHHGDAQLEGGLQARNFMLLDTSDPQPSRHILHYWIRSACAGRWSVHDGSTTTLAAEEESRADWSSLESEIAKARDTIASSGALSGLQAIMSLLADNPVLLPAAFDATALARLENDRLACDSGEEPGFVARALVSSSPTFPYLPVELAHRAEDVMVGMASGMSAPGWALSDARDRIAAGATTQPGLIRTARTSVRITGSRVLNAASRVFEGDAEGVWRDPDRIGERLSGETRELREAMLAYMDDIVDVAWPGGAVVCFAGDPGSTFRVLEDRRLDPPYDTAKSQMMPSGGDAVLLVSAVDSLDPARSGVTELRSRWGQGPEDARDLIKRAYQLTALARVDSVSPDGVLHLGELSFTPACASIDQGGTLNLTAMLKSYVEFCKNSPSCDAVCELLSLSRGRVDSWKSKFPKLASAAQPILVPAVRLLPHVCPSTTAIFVDADGGWEWSDFSDPEELRKLRPCDELPAESGMHAFCMPGAPGKRMGTLLLTDADVIGLWPFAHLADGGSAIRSMKHRSR
jgi:hypothetical protein